LRNQRWKTSSYTSQVIQVGKTDFKQLVSVEMRFVYADVFRRKSLLLMLVLWPYMITGFVLIVGSAVGNPQAFASRVGVDPAPFFIVSSFILMSTFVVLDDIMWKPIFDEEVGTMPYIVSSPVNRLMYYIAIPLPRLTLSVVIGLTSVVPVLTLYWGFEGFITSALVLLLGIFSALTFSPLATSVAMATYTYSGESWRLMNVLRPLLMVLVGVYYPRWVMPIAMYVVTALIPPSNSVELIQRLLAGIATVERSLMLLGVATALAVAYLPLTKLSVLRWERSKLKEGVKV